MVGISENMQDLFISAEGEAITRKNIIMQTSRLVYNIKRSISNDTLLLNIAKHVLLFGTYSKFKLKKFKKK